MSQKRVKLVNCEPIFYKPLHILCEFFAFVPVTDQKLKKCFNHLIILSFVFIWGSLSLYERICNFVTDSVHILDIITLLIIVFTNITTICSVNFIQNSKFQAIYQLFYLVDRDLAQFYKYEYRNNRFRTLFIIFNVTFLVYCTAEFILVLLFFGFTPRFYIGVIPLFLNIYLLNLLILQYSCVIIRIETICRFLNKKLLDYNNCLITYSKLKDSKLKSIIINSFRTKFLIENLNRIYDLVALTNQIFGVRILLIFSVILFSMVRTLDIGIDLNLIRYENAKQKSRQKYNDFRELLLFYVAILNILGSLIFLVSLIVFNT